MEGRPRRRVAASIEVRRAEQSGERRSVRRSVRVPKAAAAEEEAEAAEEEAAEAAEATEARALVEDAPTRRAGVQRRGEDAERAVARPTRALWAATEAEAMAEAREEAAMQAMVEMAIR